MKTVSSVASITVHLGIGAAVFFGTAKTGRSDPPRPHEVPIVFPQTSEGQAGGLPIPGPVTVAVPGSSSGLDGALPEEHAEVLTAPLPVYPELLRQAGVRG